ncbi:hypothetical protein PsYK624_012260 [Phanerochaete sordida]|uniref:Uncharacterized protein n=1 Tax=Phanerochaete sordida TaxID=48140 RepID=A0A9P3FYY0_9APHY|nr:hypothetical protein PsYK624_012260 [Phanerochaete sordida]
MALVPISTVVGPPGPSLDNLSEWNAILIKAPHFLKDPLATTGLAFLKVVRGLDYASDVWQTIWSTGFVLELAHVITRDHFCDFSREDLVAWTGRDPVYVGDQRALVSLVELFVLCLNKANEASFDDKIMEDVRHTMEQDFPKLWDNLWDVRTPFLDSKVACEESLIGYPSVHGCVYDLACETVKLVEMRT